MGAIGSQFDKNLKRFDSHNSETSTIPSQVNHDVAHFFRKLFHILKHQDMEDIIAAYLKSWNHKTTSTAIRMKLSLCKILTIDDQYVKDHTYPLISLSVKCLEDSLCYGKNSEILEKVQLE